MTCDALGDLEARRVGIDDEGRDPARTRRFAGAHEDDVEVGDAAVGDPGLLAVDHHVVAFDAAGAGHRRHVGAGLGFGQRECRDRLAPGHAREVAPLLLGVPASEIAPEPRPCIANAKSASPEWRASVSRIRHSARVSSASLAPPKACPATAWRSQPASPSDRTSTRHSASTSAPCECATWSLPPRRRETAPRRDGRRRGTASRGIVCRSCCFLRVVSRTAPARSPSRAANAVTPGSSSRRAVHAGGRVVRTAPPARRR